MVRSVVSGGQTGVDRAALDVALELGLSCGGWCPKGRRAEDGRIASRYPLQDTPSAAYAQRTAWNVRDADATLILTLGELSGGTAQTAVWARRYHKPVLILDLADKPNAAVARAWLRDHRVQTLNVAGPRESKRPGAYAQGARFLRATLREDSDA